MHSSRMRTVRSSGRLSGGGLYSGGVCSQGGVCSGGVSAPGGVVSQHAFRQTSPCKNVCKNITFATSLRTVNTGSVTEDQLPITYYFAFFLPKTERKLKYLDRGGAILAPPLDPPLHSWICLFVLNSSRLCETDSPLRSVADL